MLPPPRRGLMRPAPRSRAALSPSQPPPPPHTHTLHRPRADAAQVDIDALLERRGEVLARASMLSEGAVGERELLEMLGAGGAPAPEAPPSALSFLGAPAPEAPTADAPASALSFLSAPPANAAEAPTATGFSFMN